MAIKTGRAKILPEAAAEPKEPDDRKGSPTYEQKETMFDYSTADPESRQYQLRSLAGQVYETYSLWSTERINIEQTWLECRKAYLSQHSATQGVAKWKSRAFVPASFNAVENVHAQLMSGVMPTERFFEVDPASEGEDVFAAAAKEVLLHQLRTSGFRSEFSAFIKQLLTIGNSAAMLDWETEKSGDKILRQGTRARTLDMNYFHVDPFASNVQTCDVMRRYWMSHEEAEMSGAFDADALEMVNRAVAAGIATGQDESNDISYKQAAGYTTGLDPARGPLQLTEKWGRFVIDDEVYENHVATIANGVVLRFEPSPYPNGRHPFVFARYSLVHGQVYGVGILEPALPLQYLINSFTNQKVDELSIIINGMFKFKDDGVIDIDNLVAEPAALFEVADMDNIQGIAPTSSVALAYTEIADLERKFEEATGAIKLSVGGHPTGERTATEVMAITQSSNSRFNEALAHIEREALVPMLEMFLGNAADNLSDKQVIKIIGDSAEDEAEREAWLEVDKEDLARGFVIRAGGSRLVAMREFRLRNLMTYLQTVGQIEPLANRLDWDKVNARIWRDLGFDDDSVMLKPEQPQAPTAPAPQQAAPAAPNPADAGALIEQMMGGNNAAG